MKAILSSTLIIFSSSTPPCHSFTPLPTTSSPASRNTTSSSNLRNALLTRPLSNNSALSFLKDPSPWPQPKTIKELQSFLGFCNFYRHFIKDYSQVAHSLFALTKKDVPYIWATAQESAFRSLIYTFMVTPVLALPNPSLPFRVITDASDFALGAILEQPDLLNRWHPVAFFSKSMQPPELNYDIHDKELLAIIRALEAFCHYLQGHPEPFEVWSDHNNLAYFRTKQKLSRRQARWSLFLSEYNFSIIHKPGAFNKADALSRRPDHKEGMLPTDDET